MITPDDPTGTARTRTRAHVPGRATASLPERVGPYRIEGILGRGGMGVVARAHDEVGDRSVALKFLAERFAQDEAELARVEREGRLLAALRHPNVALLLGVEDDGGTPVLVLELVEGDTLADRLARGPMPLDETLRLASQVASALEAAHARGIVHRDLKPSNVKLGPDGAKVLDFGIACRDASEVPRSLASEAVDADASGFMTGTPGYMSPEQVRGEGASPAADTWALGCILHECLTGRPAFPGPTAAARLRATLETDPDLAALSADVPPGLAGLVRACLSRDPAKRPADAGEVRRRLEAVATGAPVAPAPQAAAASRPRLPRARSSFVGRRGEIADLREMVRRERLVTLTGAGGSGKTRLVLELGHLVEGEPDPRFADGVAFVELAVVADPALVPVQTALALGLVDRKGCETAETLREALAPKAMLLILDNCEHVLAAAADLVASLLAACPNLVVLATSREPLRADGETVVPLPPLRPPVDGRGADPARLLENESVALFVDRARAAKRGFVLDAGNAAAVARCCRRLDGIPLALELAAARLRQLPVDRLAEELDDCFAVLTGGSAAALPRHQALRATIDWSHDQLGPAERALYARLSIFAGPFTLALAERVAASSEDQRAAVLEGVVALQEKSLLVAEDGFRDARWRLLEPVRQHAAEMLTAASDLEATRARFVAAVSDLETTMRARLEGGTLPEALAQLSEEHPNLVEAARLAPQAGQGERQLGALGEIGTYWVARGLWREGLALLDALLVATPDAGPRPRGIALLTTAQLRMMLGDTDDASRRAEAARDLLEASGDEESLADAINTLSQVAWDRLRLDEARRFGEEALALRRKLGLTNLVTNSLNQLGVVARSAGDHAASRKYLEEAVEIQREIGNDFAMAAILSNLAVAVIDQKDYPAAVSLLHQAIDAARRAGSKRGELFGLANLASVEATTGDLAGSGRHQLAAAAIVRELGDRAGALTIVLGCARIAIERGDGARTARLQGASLMLRDGSGAKRFHRQEAWDEVAARARALVGDDGWEREAAQGRALSFDEALVLAEDVARDAAASR